jgi:hypothetical protein
MADSTPNQDIDMRFFGLTEEQFCLYFKVVSKCINKGLSVSKSGYHLSKRGCRIVNATLRRLQRAKVEHPGSYTRVCEAFNHKRKEWNVYGSIARTIRETDLAEIKHYPKDNKHFRLTYLHSFYKDNAILFELCRSVMREVLSPQKLLEYWLLVPRTQN